MKRLLSAVIAALFAAVTYTAAAQTPAPSGTSADAPKTEKKVKKQKKAKKAKKTAKSADAPASATPK